MLFNSINFLVFFIVVTFLYFISPHKYRWVLLLTSSCYFYMAFIPVYILILLITILIDYCAGIWIENSAGRKKKVYLMWSIVSTCLVLFTFKYYNFFLNSFSFISSVTNVEFNTLKSNLILPIGLSFHTFQSLSYVIEVYRGNQKAERHFGIYSLYVMFYPQLVAGPIERPQNLLHQFYEKHSLDYVRISNGLKLMVWGLIKKMVVADRLAKVVDTVYNNPHQFHGSSLIIATIFFSFQIYYDFSGYSDIAIGASQVMGFKLMENFNRPYSSKSLTEFWKRWHISLSTWFKDYIYIPLGGNQVQIPRWCLNLLITFTISGLWHGASWGFLIWGFLNGLFLIVEALCSKFLNFKLKHKLPNGFTTTLKNCFTFLVISFTWIFFRAHGLKDALYIIQNLFQNIEFNPLTFNFLGVGNIELFLCIVGICLVQFTEYYVRKKNNGKFENIFSNLPNWKRWSLYYMMIISIVLFGVFEKSQFIYFQF
jgi:alginate O-acetyltransferase complex protein AlgI